MNSRRYLPTSSSVDRMKNWLSAGSSSTSNHPIPAIFGLLEQMEDVPLTGKKVDVGLTAAIDSLDRNH